jgi:predicted histone-like DNA-binding protein
MSKYSIIARKDPGDANAEPKFYPILKSVDRIDTAYIGGCLKNPSVSEGDVYSIIINLFKLIPKELAHGRVIGLGDLGSLSLKANAKGSDTAEEVSSDDIKKVSVRFRPTQAFYKMLGLLKFERNA